MDLYDMINLFSKKLVIFSILHPTFILIAPPKMAARTGSKNHINQLQPNFVASNTYSVQK